MIWAGRGVFFGLASGFLVFVSLDLPLLPLPCPWLGTVTRLGCSRVSPAGCRRHSGVTEGLAFGTNQGFACWGLSAQTVVLPHFFLFCSFACLGRSRLVTRIMIPIYRRMEIHHSFSLSRTQFNPGKCLSMDVILHMSD